MTIGIDASRANSDHKTGTEWYSYHVIQELKQLIPSDVAVRLYSKESLKGALAALPANWSSVVLQWPPRFMWSQLRLSIEMLIAPVDLLYVPAHTIPLMHPTRVLTVVHDVGFARQKALYGRVERAYHQFSAQRAFSAASEIITVSEFSKREMIELYGIDAQRITVIPNGMNDLNQLPDDAAVLDRFQITTPYFFYLGRLEHKKNTPRLVKAFAELTQQIKQPVQLVLAGSEGFGMEEVKQTIEAAQLEEKIKMIGWVSEQDAATLMKHAHAFVFPSQYEGFGIPVLEAMHVGTPVIASRIPALEEVAGDAALFFQPNSVTELTDAMRTMIEQTDLRTALIAKGTARAKQYSWRRTAEETWKRIQHSLPL